MLHRLAVDALAALQNGGSVRVVPGFMGFVAENGGICSAPISSGLFASMRELNDVQAIFCGHDHNNDNVTIWNGMCFVYGRYSGCDTVYNDLKPSGARIIELTSGSRSFRSWIRLSDGRVIQDLRYPEDYMRGK